MTRPKGKHDVTKVQSTALPKGNTKYRSSLPDNEKESFAYELALGYYTNDELRHIFKLLPSAFGFYAEHEVMQVMVSQKKREIDESDSALRIHARKAARIAIDELAMLVRDEDAPAKTRMAAGKELREYAFAADRNALKGDGASDGPIYLKTNLHIGDDARGVYTVSAEEAEEQVGEAMEQESESDFLGLLGI